MYFPRLIRVPCYRSHRAFSIRLCLGCNRHQTSYQLTKRPIAHKLILVELLEFQTSGKSGIPLRTNIKPRRGVFSKILLRNRQSTSIQISRKTTTSASPRLAQIIDRNKAVKTFTKPIASSLKPYSKAIIHIH